MLIPFLSKHIPVLFLIKACWALLRYYFSSDVEAALWYCQEVLRKSDIEREKVRKRAGMCVCVLISNYFMYMFAHSPV